MKLLRSVVISLSCVLMPVLAHAAPICPTLSGASSAYYAADTPASSNCNTIITIGPGNTFTFTYPNTHPYDGSDDNYVGVVNDSGASIGGFTLSGSGIFGFDGDGIDRFGLTANATDKTGYGGGDAFFTAIKSNTGTVNFLGGIGDGGTGYFSLETAPSSASLSGGGVIPTVPEPSSLVLLGTGVLGVAGAIRRRLKA